MCVPKQIRVHFRSSRKHSRFRPNPPPPPSSLWLAPSPAQMLMLEYGVLSEGAFPSSSLVSHHHISSVLLPKILHTASYYSPLPHPYHLFIVFPVGFENSRFTVLSTSGLSHLSYLLHTDLPKTINLIIPILPA